LRVRQRDVDEDALEEDEDADREDDDADGGDDPVDLGRVETRPRKHEEAYGSYQGRVERGNETPFGGAEAGDKDFGLEDVAQVPHVDRDGDGDADADGEEDQADLAGVEAVALCWLVGDAVDVDHGKDLEEGVEDTVDESDVDRGKKHGGIEGVDLDGAPEIGDYDVRDGEFGLIDL